MEYLFHRLLSDQNASVGPSKMERQIVYRIFPLETFLFSYIMLPLFCLRSTL